MPLNECGRLGIYTVPVLPMGVAGARRNVNNVSTPLHLYPSLIWVTNLGARPVNLKLDRDKVSKRLCGCTCMYRTTSSPLRW